MIPKRVFYVWGAGEEKSRLADICIENWRMMLPGFEIVEVGEKSGAWFDFDYEYEHCLWFKTVYDLKMWAYVSDYIRVKVVHDHGGVYLDTDVTLYKNLAPMLSQKMFLSNSIVNTPEMAVFGAEKGHPYLRDMIEFYQERIWKSKLYIITTILKDILQSKYGVGIRIHETLENELMTLYPPEYFNPYHYGKPFSHDMVTPNTYAVHWQNGSWQNRRCLYFLMHKHCLPLKVLLRQMEFIARVDAKANCKTVVTDNGKDGGTPEGRP